MEDSICKSLCTSCLIKTYWQRNVLKIQIVDLKHLLLTFIVIFFSECHYFGFTPCFCHQRNNPLKMDDNHSSVEKRLNDVTNSAFLLHYTQTSPFLIYAGVRMMRFVFIFFATVSCFDMYNPQQGSPSSEVVREKSRLHVPC